MSYDGYFPTREDISEIVFIEILETAGHTLYVELWKGGRLGEHESFLLPNGSKLVKSGDYYYISYYDRKSYGKDVVWILENYGPYID